MSPMRSLADPVTRRYARAATRQLLGDGLERLRVADGYLTGVTQQLGAGPQTALDVRWLGSVTPWPTLCGDLRSRIAARFRWMRRVDRFRSAAAYLDRDCRIGLGILNAQETLLQKSDDHLLDQVLLAAQAGLTNEEITGAVATGVWPETETLLALAALRA